MIVLDSSAAVAALLGSAPAREAIASAPLHAPHLIDVEVAQTLRRLAQRRAISSDQGWAALATFSRLGFSRYPTAGFVERIWELRRNVSAYDATYVALAEALGSPLLTADGRLARAPGLRCSVQVVPGT